MAAYNTASIVRVAEEGFPRSIVVRERSELADRLRANGWVARAGWLSANRTTSRIWLIRLEHPSFSIATRAA